MAPGDAVRVIDVATGEVQLLATTNGTISLGAIQFSPEGNRVLFWERDFNGGGAGALWSVRVDGSDRQLLVAGTDQGGWQP